LEQSLSIIIPTLNALRQGAELLRTLCACAEANAEIVFADGGSTDGCQAIGAAGGFLVIEAPRGRGTQLAAGVGAAAGDWLLFLHADTRLAKGWSAAARAFMADPANAWRAAYFTFALDDPAPQARRLERLVAWRCQVLGLPYGDQGLLISRALYEHIGGFRPLPLMEDVDLVRRIGRRRLVALPVVALTSAERWRRDGWTRRSARNLACLALWFAGVPPRWIVRLYG